MEILKNAGLLYYMALAAEFCTGAVFYLWLRQLFDQKKHSPVIAVLFGVGLSAAVTAAQALIHNEPLIYVVLFAAVFVMILLLLQPALDEAVMCALFLVLQYMISRGTALGGYSLYINRNMYQILQDGNGTSSAFLISWLLTLVFVLLYSSSFGSSGYSYIRRFPVQKSFLVMINGILFLFLLFNCYNYYYNMEMIWFSVSEVITSLLCQGALNLAFRHAIQVSRMQAASPSLDPFQKEVPAGMYELIADTRKECGQAPLSFCTDPLLDAVLMQAYAVARHNRIAFEANVAVPQDMSSAARKNLQNTLSQMLSYSFSLIQKVDPSLDRYIQITSAAQSGWVTLKLAVPYAGLLKIKNKAVINSPAWKEASSDIVKHKGVSEAVTDQQKHRLEWTVRCYCGK